MTVHTARVWWVAITLLLWTQSAHCRNFTNEDMRDLLLAMGRTIQSSENKLERHEYREKSLGEQLKRTLSGIEKKQRGLEPLSGIITRLDERLSNVETILLQKEEREKKTQEELEGIKQALQLLTNTVTQAMKPVTKEDTDIDNNLTTSDDTIDRRLDITDAKIDAVKKEIENLKKTLLEDTLRATCLDLSDDINPLKIHISNADNLLSKYEQKLKEYNATISKAQTDSASLDDVSLADEAWHNKMSEVLTLQEKDIKKIQQLLLDAESMWKDLPRRSDLQLATNQTLHAIVNATENTKENNEKSCTIAPQEKDIKKIQQLLLDAESMWKDLPRRSDLQLATNQTLHAIVNATENTKEHNEKSIGKVATEVEELSDRLVATNTDIQNSLTLGNTMSEQAFRDISKSYDTLRAEIEKLTKNEHLLFETSNNVLSTKKRVEYGLNQLVEVEKFIKAQTKNLNTTVHERFNNIETTIGSNQTASVSTLTAKIESETAQVWRQIGVMHQQLTTNKGALDSLTILSQQYIKSSSKSMRSLKDEVERITSNIDKLGGDMNFALGQLSVSTQEFGRMSVSLGEALNDLKNRLPADKSKPTDSKPDGPGPHPIPTSEKTP